MYNLGMIDISKVVESTSFTDSRTSLDMDRRFNFDQFNLCTYDPKIQQTRIAVTKI